MDQFLLEINIDYDIHSYTQNWFLNYTSPFLLFTIYMWVQEYWGHFRMAIISWWCMIWFISNYLNSF